MKRCLGIGSSASGAARRSRRLWALIGCALAAAGATVGLASAGVQARSGGATVWLCEPKLADDPCLANRAATVISSSGGLSTQAASPAQAAGFDCFYVYPTVSREPITNAELKVQKAEITAAVAQASRFSQVCNVYAPIYRQVTLAGLAAYPKLNLPPAEEQLAYTTLLAGFEQYLAQDNNGRPIAFIGHSQGAALLIDLLGRVVEHSAALRKRLLLAIILGGDVEVRPGSLDGGSFKDIPLCSRSGETGCVIAYSSFPGEPPAASLFGRPGQGVTLQSGETAKRGVQVACVNPAALGGGSGLLDPYFPSEGLAPQPWVEFPGLYQARCESSGGATWLEVTKATGASDKRPLVTEDAGPDWGYHTDDVNLALGNLVSDLAAAERSWTASH